MKNIAVVSITKTGKERSEEIFTLLNQKGYNCEAYNSDRNPCEAELISTLKETRLWIEENMKKVDAFVFVCSTDIAVRMIADFLEDKMKDPAVVVVDEVGQYVIPLMGNHLAGANELGNELGKLVNATCIQTTPIEVREKFRVETFAKNNDMEIGDREQARAISLAILEGQHMGFYCEYPIKGVVPSGLTICQDMKELSWYSQRIAIRFQYVVGLGCKEGVPFANLEQLFLQQINELGLDMVQVSELATIDTRGEEPAIVALSEKYKIPILTFSTEELSKVGNTKSICESAALLGSKFGEVVCQKIGGKGVTFAAVKKNKIIKFEG